MRRDWQNNPIRRNQPDFTVVELAYILNIDKKQVRQLFITPREDDPSKMVLPAFKERNIWRVKRADLMTYVEDKYGARSCEQRAGPGLAGHRDHRARQEG
jgi:hypothetical protein